MTQPNVGPLTRVGGNIALDYANTVSWAGTAQQVDHLGSVESLLAWFRDAAAAEPTILQPRLVARLRRDLRARPEAGDGLFLTAVQLRAAVTAVGTALAAGAAPAREALEVLKRTGVATLAHGRIAPAANDGCRFDFRNAPPDAALLGPIAWAAIDLLRSDQLRRLKQCPACDCRWLFLDTTKNGSRRWCDMTTCGNRNKVNRFRRHGASKAREAQ